jgi:hypothetical protein
MDAIERICIELELTIRSPRLYIAEYFDLTRNEIDLETQLYIQKSKDSEGAIEQQLIMIDEVNLFEKKCLSNIDLNALELLKMDKKRLQVINLRFQNEELLFELERYYYCLLFRRKEIIFKKQSVIFFGMEKCHFSFQITRSGDKLLMRNFEHPCLKNSKIKYGILLKFEDAYVQYNKKYMRIE